MRSGIKLNAPKSRPAESSRLSSARLRRQPVVVMALTLLCVWLAGCGDRAEPQSIPPVASKQQSPPESPISRPAKPRTDYVGSKVCAACHEEISNTFAAHPMARSLGEVDGVSVVENYSDRTELLRPEIAGTAWSGRPTACFITKSGTVRTGKFCTIRACRFSLPSDRGFAAGRI